MSPNKSGVQRNRKQKAEQQKGARASHTHITGLWEADTPPSTFSFWSPPSHNLTNGPGRNHNPISGFLPFSGLHHSIVPCTNSTRLNEPPQRHCPPTVSRSHEARKLHNGWGGAGASSQDTALPCGGAGGDGGRGRHTPALEINELLSLLHEDF